MSPTEIALLGFVAWTVFLLICLGVYRTTQVMTKGRTANSFTPSGDDVGPCGKRLTRAHANCYENLPIVGSVLLYAIATDQTALTDGLAYAFLIFRIAQSSVHLISTENFFVRIRFFFFLPQIGIVIFWLLKLFHVF